MSGLSTNLQAEARNITHLSPPASVAIDSFQLPAVQWCDETYDAIALCVDRLRGWMTAIPGRIGAMTAELVTQEMKHGH